MSKYPAAGLRRSPTKCTLRGTMGPLVAALAATTLISCSTEIARVTEPSAVDRLSVCHVSGAAGVPITIRASELAAHRAHGDYVTTIAVHKESTTTSDSTSFARIGDAIARACAIRLVRSELTTAACRITIAVESGVYEGSVAPSTDPSLERLPLVIDVPDITLRGSFVMPIDAKARALGTSPSTGSDLQAVLVASPGLISVRTGNVLEKFAEPLIILNGHPAGSRGDGATIEGFVFRSGNVAPDAIVGGNAVWGMRVQRVTVRRNRIEAGFAEPIEFRASSARVEQNLLTGRSGSCAFCMFGPGT
ncbi:MAG: hypothetical protein V4617_18520 [Gemmatimonadota bacterium]